MHNLTSTAGIVALAAAGVAVLALLFCIVLAVRLHRVRADQRAILGDTGHDLVAHAATLQQQFQALHDYVQDIAEELNRRVETAEQHLFLRAAGVHSLQGFRFGRPAPPQAIAERIARQTRTRPSRSSGLSALAG